MNQVVCPRCHRPASMRSRAIGTLSPAIVRRGLDGAFWYECSAGCAPILLERPPPLELRAT